MANKKRGEYPVTIGGEDLLICYTVNAIELIEDRFDKPIMQLLQGLEEGGFRVSILKFLLWAGLEGAKQGKSIDWVGDNIDLTDIKDISEAIGKALSLAFTGKEAPEENPTQQKAAPKKGKARS